MGKPTASHQEPCTSNLSVPELLSIFGGKNGEWDPKLEQLTIKESAEYSNEDFQVLSTSVRANSNLVKFLGDVNCSQVCIA